MAEIDLEAVLEFLRRNRLSESESALMQDVSEKSDLGASFSDKFSFPMARPPPPLRIPMGKVQPPRRFNASLDGSSGDEFLSLGSSTGLCSSEFINPYGIHSTCQPSQASSDGMSQFGTARDIPDFDMQNDHFWYKERDEDYAMPPLYVARELVGDLSEDRYVMPMNVEGSEKQLRHSDIKSEDVEDQLRLNLSHKSQEPAFTDYFDLNEHFLLQKDDEILGGHQDDFKCSSPLCACCNDGIIGFESNSENHEAGNLYRSDWNRTVVDSIVLNASLNEIRTSANENSDFVQREVNGRIQLEPEVETKEEGVSPSEELLIYDTHDEDDDDYEVFDLRIIHRKNRTGFEENKDFPIAINSIVACRYFVMEFLGSAAFSKVVQAHDLHLGIDVCLKIIKNNKDFFDQSLDEIKLLKFVNKNDPYDAYHVLRLYDYFYFQVGISLKKSVACISHISLSLLFAGTPFIVTELLRENLYEFQKFNKESGGEAYFTMHRLQSITRQCLEALMYLHDLGIIHCDLKPENILIKSYRRCEIKMIDLGSSCFLKDSPSMYIQSRSYRAPEVILGLPYDQKIDIWSIGCILAELYSGEVLFANEAVAVILARMIGILGPIESDMLQNGQYTDKYFTEDYDLYTINEETNVLEYIVPEESSLEKHLHILDPDFLDFLKCLLEINPQKRPTAEEALRHPWFENQ